MRDLKIYSTILASVLLVFFGVIYWPSFTHFKNETINQSIRQELHELQLAENHYKKAQYDEVLKLVLNHVDSLESGSDLGRQWLDLLVDTSVKTYDVQQLVLIDEQYPQSLEKNEKASLIVAESYIMKGQKENYRAIRDKWAKRQPLSDAWQLLDADELLHDGHYAKGYELLEQTQMTGQDEIARLTRLALLNIMDNPQKALGFLESAHRLDPTNLDIYLYKIKLLEKLEKPEVLEVYSDALLHNPKSIFMHDQLAIFYLREQQYFQAIETWKKALNIAAEEGAFNQGEILANLIFFDRLMQGEQNKWDQYSYLAGPLKPFIDYLMNLKQDQFHDEAAFSKLPQKEEYLENIQITYLAKLFEALKQNDQEKILEIIHGNPFKEVSFDPLLELYILQAINVQRTGSTFQTGFGEAYPDQHPLIRALTTNGHIPSDIRALLQSEEAFSAILLASSLSNAALVIHQMDHIPDHFPLFVAYDLTKSLRKFQGDSAALAFASKQRQSVNLAFLVQEMTAKLALENNNPQLADKIYEAIQDRSFEAKSYLAKKAYTENKFKLAEKLTNELLEHFPNNPLLLDNLKKIQARI